MLTLETIITARGRVRRKKRVGENVPRGKTVGRIDRVAGDENLRGKVNEATTGEKNRVSSRGNWLKAETATAIRQGLIASSSDLPVY